MQRIVLAIQNDLLFFKRQTCSSLLSKDAVASAVRSFRIDIMNRYFPKELQYHASHLTSMQSEIASNGM